MKYVLACNAGSSSLRFGLYDWPSGRLAGRGRLERIGTPRADVQLALFGRTVRLTDRRTRTHRDAARLVVRQLRRVGLTERSLVASVHRIVHGGGLARPLRLTPSLSRRLRRLQGLAPLHNPPALDVAETMRAVFRRVPVVVAFDTAFFAALPEVARTYAINARTARRFGIHRYGFHGLSHAFAARAAARALGRRLPDCRLLTVHLGAGCSIAAIDGGRPIDTSMGFTPSEGLVMGRRSGDLDPGIILHLLRQGWTVDALDRLVNRSGGLLGLSGLSDDMRDIMVAAGHPVREWVRPKPPTAEQRAGARRALNLFIYRVRKYLGAYAAVLGRVDAVVFTGAIGERSAVIRRLVMRGLHLPGSPRVVVVSTDEERELLRELRRVRR